MKRQGLFDCYSKIIKPAEQRSDRPDSQTNGRRDSDENMESEEVLRESRTNSSTILVQEELNSSSGMDSCVPVVI